MPAPYPCIVLLHGRGSNEEDLFGLVPELPDGTLVVSVRAPFPMAWGGFFWYELGPQGSAEETSFRQSLAQLRDFLTELPEKYAVDRNRIFVGGFSQGALMSGCLTLAEPSLVAGTVILSGYLPLDLTLNEDKQGVAGKPVFMAHGRYDSVLPLDLAHQAREYLRKAGVDLDYYEYPMDHQVIAEELVDLKAWLQRRDLV